MTSTLDLRQLKANTNAIFQCYIQDLHVQYQEAKLLDYTPMNLILDVEERIRVLKHAEVWGHQPTQEMPPMALKSAVEFPSSLKDFIANHITTELKCLTQKPSKDRKGSSTKNGCTSLWPRLLRLKQEMQPW